MIVTCESCKSRYKLDDAKVTGRGAKITCPRCKFVFVVYARPPESAGSALPGSPPDPPRTAPPERPAAPAAAPARPTWDDDEPTRIGMTSPPAATVPAAQAPTHEVARQDLNMEDRARNSASRSFAVSPMAARAATLDFRKVGVTTWKVKVRIGLVYDFSDIKTLRKYIQDGRVTSADVISWDGKTWKPIGDIPDLDAFFVETWERLEAARADAPPEPPKEPARAAPPPEPSQPSAPGPTPFIDPFLQQRQKTGRTQPTTPVLPPPQARSKEQPAPKGLRNAILAAIAVAVVLAIVAIVLNQQPEGAPAAGGTIKPGTSTEAPKDVEDIKNKIERDLRNNPATQPVGAQQPAMQPVQPPPGGTNIPPNAMPVQPPASQRTAPATTQGGVQQGEQTARDHEEVGDGAAQRKDWKMAVTAYQKAVAMDGGSARLQEKLGEAQYAAGDPNAAQATLQKAAKLGSKDAYKYLGHIAKDQGDAPGAIGYYQQYLATKPRDAADIDSIIRGLSGG